MAKSESTALMSIEEQMLLEVAELSKRIDPSGARFINLTGKMFTMPGGAAQAGPISAVVIDFINVYTYYTTGYKAGVRVEPVCRAIGPVISEMHPLDDVEDKQSDLCTSCPQYQWGSGNGNAKACKTERVLAIVQPDKQGDGQIMLIKASPTGAGFFDKYVKSVKERLSVPLWGVITEISFSSNETYPSLRFTCLGKNEGNETAAFSRKIEAASMLTSL